jgi:hypothetical protein
VISRIGPRSGSAYVAVVHRRQGFRARATLIVLGGVLVGVVAFAFTGSYPQVGYLGPLCRSDEVRAAGFDPWTGLPVGSIYRCDPTHPQDPPSHLVPLPVPDDLVGRRAIPVPVEFAAGVVLGLLLMRIRDRSRRSVHETV